MQLNSWRKNKGFSHKTVSRSSRLQMFFKIGVLINFQEISQENIFVEAPFLIQLEVWRPATLIEREPGTSVFLWIPQIFSE